MNVISLDFESSISTSIHGPTFRGPENDIYTQIIGLSVDNVKVLHNKQGFKRKLCGSRNWLRGVDLIIGHNIGFDLSYIWHDEQLREFLLGGGKIWDCFTGGTEILTSKGWQRFDNLERGLEVAQYNTDGSITFVRPVAYIDKPYNGKLLSLSNGRHINHLSTPDHHRVVRTFKYGKLRLEPANSKTSLFSHHKALLAGLHDGSGLDFTDTELRLIVAIQADAYITKQGYVQFEFSKQRKVDRLKDLAYEAGLELRGGTNTSGSTYRARLLGAEKLIEDVKVFGNIDPVLMTLHQKLVFIEELQYWDGHKTSQDTIEYYSYRSESLEKVQIIASLAGRRALLNDKRVSIVNKDYCVQNSMTKSEVDYNGRVYCVTVPSSMIVIRHGGQVQVTGNCQVAEYLLTGQQHAFSSLAELQLKYLNEVEKPSRISALYKKGVGADKIVAARDRCKRMFALYEYYCHTDGSTPLKIYELQKVRAEKEGMMPIIELYNDYLLALINMEVTGIQVDIKRCEKTLQEFNLKHLEYLEMAQNVVKEFWTDPRLPEFNINSPDHKSAILFGGDIKIVERECIGQYKNGKDKYKNVEKLVHISGFRVPASISSASKKLGLYCTDDGTMQKIAAKTTNPKLKQYCEYQKQSMMYKKAAKTYCQAFIDRSVGGVLHPNFNNTLTATGRLSSSNPNLQNVSKRNQFGKDLHSLFVAPPGWKCVQIDFAQLEIWVLAMLSGDKLLTQHLLDGTDLHVVRLGYYNEDKTYDELYKLCKIDGDEYWNKQRTYAKTVSYQMAYGAMPKKVAESTGLDIGIVEKIFEKEKETYADAANFGVSVREGLEHNMHLSLASNIPASQKRGKDGARISNGIELLPIFDKSEEIVYNEQYKRKVGYYVSPTGKKYHFLNSGRSFHGNVSESFSFTQPKNFPMQGTASDVQACSTTALLKALLGKGDRIKMINEIHDSKWLYVREDVLKPCLKWLKDTIEDVPKIFKERFGLDVPFKFPVDIEIGGDFGHMEKYDFNSVGETNGSNNIDIISNGSSDNISGGSSYI